MSSVPHTALRWAPRFASLLLGGGYLLVVAGEMITPHAAPPSSWREWTGIALCSMACLAPLAAWRWRVQASAVSLVALAAFAAVVQFSRYDVLLVMAMPALLFFLDNALRPR
ncbi:MAG TPA: hypothetical protein VGK29_15200 [Paludibaculum sp.]|jgi:hypothetical protein